MRKRVGAALAEVLVAAALMSVVAATAVALLHAQSRVGERVSKRSENNEARRTALHILNAEISELAPTRDLRAVARDSIAARIFRGLGIVCGHQGELTFLRYRGLRLPDASKDSALQVGVENTIPLADVKDIAGVCAGSAGEHTLSLTIRPAPPNGSLWLVFESGTYHLSAHALRYRRGIEGRQPITNEVFDDRRSGFELIADSSGHALRLILGQRASDAVARARIGLANGR